MAQVSLTIFRIAVVVVALSAKAVVASPSDLSTSSDQSTKNAIPRSEYNSMLGIFTTTQGSSWTYPISTPQCNPWTLLKKGFITCADNLCGTTCVTRNGQSHITAIQLPGYNLNSTSPLPCFNFHYLEILDLTSNHLEGPLPASVFDSPYLSQLRVTYSGLDSIIPSSIGKASSLVDFDINTNYFDGEIPKSIGNLKKMQNFYLYSNRLEGSIPESIGDMDEVQFIWLQSNRLTGSVPASLGKLQRVANINLSNNYLDGTLPSSIYNAGAGYLHDLNLSHNKISGVLPKGISALTVITLDLSYNEFSGRIPSEIASLPNIRYLYLNNNHVSADIPKDVLVLCASLNASGGACDLSNQTPIV